MKSSWTWGDWFEYLEDEPFNPLPEPQPAHQASAKASRNQKKDGPE
jgi:hypothetical protein